MSDRRRSSLMELYSADLEAVADFLRAGRTFCVTSHQSPDGDALASTLALTLGLRAVGKTVTPYNRDPVPQNLRFLPSWQNVVSDVKSFRAFDGILVVDCGDIDRIREGFAREPKAKVVNIDHHVTNPRYGDLNLIIPEAGASGQVVYYLLKTLGVPMTADIAWSIFTCLVVDTGSFQYSNTTPETMRMAAELLDLGVRPEVVTDALNNHVPMKKWKLLSHALGTLRVELSGRLATMDVTQAMLRDSGATFEDNEGFIEMVRQLDGVEVAALLKEHGPDKVKVSFRAKDRVDVARIASVFGGGGHKNAAGCTLHADLSEARRRVLEEVRKSLEAGGPP